jgi:hypothetical protein
MLQIYFGLDACLILILNTKLEDSLSFGIIFGNNFRV